MSTTYYSSRKGLNPKKSRSTGSVVCFDGMTESAEGLDRDSFIEISDCRGKVKLHKSSEDSPGAFILKLTLLRDEIDRFIDHLRDVKK